jgi:hypothetical protein
MSSSSINSLTSNPNEYDINKQQTMNRAISSDFSYPIGGADLNVKASGDLKDIEKSPLMEVTCYKCGEKGHYANKCNKGAYFFLSQNKQ